MGSNNKMTCTLDEVIGTLRENVARIERAEIVDIATCNPPKEPGVYMLYFEGELQYIGYSGNLRERIKSNLLSGDRESHTLINKLCELKRAEAKQITSFLKSNCSIKFISTANEDDAHILEDTLIAINHPFYNIPLRKIKKRGK